MVLLHISWDCLCVISFHILFPAFTIGLASWLAFLEWRWLRTQQEVYLDLAKSWSKGVAIFFAVGAVSGTVLSFELGLLWPRFMEYAGEIFGMPFSWEGTAFFLEASFLGVMLFGWTRVGPGLHFVSTVMVAVGRTASLVKQAPPETDMVRA